VQQLLTGGEFEALDDDLLAQNSRRQKWKSTKIRGECRTAYQYAFISSTDVPGLLTSCVEKLFLSLHELQVSAQPLQATVQHLSELQGHDLQTRTVALAVNMMHHSQGSGGNHYISACNQPSCFSDSIILLFDICYIF
jgi:hypothetical protein